MNLTYELQFREFLNKSEEKSLEKTRIHSEIFWLLNTSKHYSIYPNRLENKTLTIVYIFAYRNTQCFLIFSTKIFLPSFLNFVLLMIKDRCRFWFGLVLKREKNKVQLQVSRMPRLIFRASVSLQSSGPTLKSLLSSRLHTERWPAVQLRDLQPPPAQRPNLPFLTWARAQRHLYFNLYLLSQGHKTVHLKEL